MSDQHRLAQIHFERLRHALHQTPSASNWLAIRQATANVLAGDPDGVAIFRAQYLPALRALMEARYPPETRTIQLHEPLGTREFCATLVLDFSNFRMEQYAKSLGMTHRRGITRKMIEELLPHWLEGVESNLRARADRPGPQA